MKTILALLLTVSVAAPAAAQYYERPPPGYYAPRGEYPPPRYRVRLGARCDAVLETPYGPRQMICPIVEPKPLGEPCGCPPPRRSGYRGEYVAGSTIR